MPFSLEHFFLFHILITISYWILWRHFVLIKPCISIFNFLHQFSLAFSFIQTKIARVKLWEKVVTQVQTHLCWILLCLKVNLKIIVQNISSILIHTKPSHLNHTKNIQSILWLYTQHKTKQELWKEAITKKERGRTRAHENYKAARNITKALTDIHQKNIHNIHAYTQNESKHSAYVQIYVFTTSKQTHTTPLNRPISLHIFNVCEY